VLFDAFRRFEAIKSRGTDPIQKLSPFNLAMHLRTPTSRPLKRQIAGNFHKGPFPATLFAIRRGKNAPVSPRGANALIPNIKCALEQLTPVCLLQGVELVANEQGDVIAAAFLKSQSSLYAHFHRIIRFNERAGCHFH
jgi:hypothetical protein